MDEAPLLVSIALFTLLAGVCAIVFNKAKLPPLIGYLAAGIIISNSLVISVTGMEVVEMLSDFGLVLLMFCIGLEVNLTKIKKQGRLAILVAIVQLPLMVIGGMAAGAAMGMDGVQSMTLGAIISGSSTAVVMAVLRSQNKLNKSHIEMLVLITIMEDIGQVIILSMLTPVLAGSSMEVSDLVVLVTTIAIFMIASLSVGMKYAPKIMNWITDHVPWETSIVIAVGMAFGMALLATEAGLSMAIGSFLMGMLMASARKGEDINKAIDPMKSLFMAMFFISVGMEVRLDTLVQNAAMVVCVYVLFAVLKTSTVSLGYWIGGQDGRNGFLSAVGLTAMGEFAFIIAKKALDFGVVDDAFYTSIIGAALLSMIMLPLLTRASDGIWTWLESSCPAPIKSRIEAADRYRDGLYADIGLAGKKTRKVVRRGMAYAYVDVLVILIIEIVFYAAAPVVSPVLSGMFGGDVHLWDFALVMLNFVILIPPMTYLVDNLKRLDSLIANNSRRMAAKRTAEGKSAANLYEEFLEINTFAAVTILILALIIIVPNPLTLTEHLAVIAVAVLISVLLILRRRKSREQRREGLGGARGVLFLNDALTGHAMKN
ncbi:MAG: cation:proton antiporter [Candidatus Methanomethylophilaceae archaeon]|nr:cation:proton antiporter [Candidatus Methanomethylophilaceae archaeon]